MQFAQEKILLFIFLKNRPQQQKTIIQNLLFYTPIKSDVVKILYANIRRKCCIYKFFGKNYYAYVVDAVYKTYYRCRIYEFSYKKLQCICCRCRIYEFSYKKLQCVWYNSGAGGAPTPAHVQNHTPRGAPCQWEKVNLF